MSLMESMQRSARMQRWVSRRLPRLHGVTLTQRQIFIFLTTEGGLYSGLLLITFVCGINYANNLVLGLCFFLASVLMVTIHHTFSHLSGLHVEVMDATDSQAGGHSQYRVRIAPTGSKPHRQLLLQWDGHTQQIDTLSEPVVLTFALSTPTRGLFLPPRLTVSTVYPLGVLRAWTYVHFDEQAWVAPLPLPNVLSGARVQAADDDDNADRVAGQDEFEELKDFVAGESMARISWGHFARGQGLLSKQFSDARGREQLLDYAQMVGPDHESRLSQLAYWVHQLTQEQVSYALRLPDVELPVGAGPLQQQHALRLLAEQPT